MQTVEAALKHAALLLSVKSPTPRADAQLLLAYVLGCSRDWLPAHGEHEFSEAQSEQYDALCKKRAAGVPIAYITGFAGFYKREFAVNEHVLIPRPETEHLVEDAVAHLKGKSAPSVFEAGVGSGAIACSIAAEVPGALIDGTDISADALQVAQDNARRLDVHARCSFYRADVVPENPRKRYDLVVANLPYIPSADVPRKPDPVGYEPRTALDGGADGLDLYRKLLAAAPQMLAPGALLLMEAAPPTMRALREMTRAALPGTNVEVRSDYAGQERYVYVKVPSGR